MGRRLPGNGQSSQGKDNILSRQGCAGKSALAFEQINAVEKEKLRNNKMNKSSKSEELTLRLSDSDDDSD